MELLALFILLQVGDAASTLVFLKKGIKEANPVLARLFEQFGAAPTLLVMKGALCYLAYYMMDRPYWFEAVAAMCVVYAGVVVHNIRDIRKS